MRYVLALLAALVCATGAAAQPYPNKPIRIVVGFTPGGTTDILARLVGQAMSESLGTAVVIENRPGASAMIGDDVVAKAPGDGYTLGMMASPHATNASLYARVPYDVATDFTSIALVARTKHVLVVGLDVPARSLPELVAWIKAQPGAVSYGSNAVGGRTHLAAELLARAAGLRLVHIPYKGSTPVLTALMGGEIPFTFENTAVLGGLISAGKVRPLAIASAARSLAFPDLPTFAEAGYPDFVADGWFGIRGPAHIPADRVARLNAVIVAALATPAMRTRMLELGTEPAGGSPADFDRFIAADGAQWGQIIRDAGIKGE
ncbi:MAG: tripartite tricarboxylate transporter substrate binding protein [Alphaproteobacteria bacterium]|nr:tripartite tricarboxylate transporter substrate binding protein [Alphaproteobacteria bacterium]